MTFKLYHVAYRGDSYYDYSINGLTGAHDNRLLPAFVALVSSSSSLLLGSCVNFADYWNEEAPHDRIGSLSPIFTADYRDASELRANLRTDLQRLFPEEFV